MANNTLVIVESPAKAKTIAKFLGKNYAVTACNGHVRDLPKSVLGVDVAHDFAPKYQTMRGKGEVLETIKKQAKEADKIYLATDPDREGEAISWHLAQVLKIDPAQKCRIEFHEITKNAVQGAIKNVRSVNMDKVNAQQARRVLDRLIGYKLSPVLWAKVRKGLSAGRVQSVATRIICDREEEILAFIPQEYWTITAQFGEGKKNSFTAKYFGRNGKKAEIENKAQADEILALIDKRPFTVTDIKTAEKKKHPAPPFTTSNLQQEASRKLGFTAKRTMMVAQQLYEGVSVGKRGATGLITYIRTDSVRVAGEAIDAVRAHIQQSYGNAYLPETANFYRGRKSAQDAHEAIRPTDLTLEPRAIREHLTGDQYKLYRLVYERFVASQMTDALVETKTVTLDANTCTFRAIGNTTLFPGFTKIYTEGQDAHAEDEGEGSLPRLSVGEVHHATKIIPEQKFTQAPPRYTEATLVKALEEQGIGRPSTYAPTISTIVDRGYVAREKKSLYPTELGFIVTKLMKENFTDIVNVQFTAAMEDKLDTVEEGSTAWVALVAEFYGPFELTIKKAQTELERVKMEDRVSEIPCDKCGALLVYKMGRYGEFLACPNYPDCKTTKPILDKVGVSCPKCGGEVVKRRSKRGKTFFGCEKYPECDYVSWDKPVATPCPQCGAQMVQKIGQHGSYVQCTSETCKHILRREKKADKGDE
ncbi:MAG: type I DNA topoisomerase [Clostridiales bacterium]|nr:type I DNA topoisomerase [Clostridiales bacterium]